MEFDPGYASAYRELGWVLFRRGPAPETESCLRKAVKLAPEDASAHIYLGTYLSDCGSVDAASAQYRIAEELDPGWAVPLWSIGNVYEYNLEDYDSAQSFYERALQLEPDSQAALLRLGRLCKKRGQFDLAREYLTRVLLKDPPDQNARALLAEC